MAKIQLISETRALDKRKPGFALLKISGWKHGPEQTQMSIQRSEDEKYLSMDGQWEPIPFWISLDKMNSEAGDILEGDVGPALVDPIVNSPNNSYRITLKSEESSETKTMRIDGDVLSSSASGSAPDSLALGDGFILDDTVVSAPIVEELEVPEPVVKDSVSESVVEDKEIDTIEPAIGMTPNFFARYKKPLIIFLIAIILALLAGTAWYFKDLLMPEELLEEQTSAVPAVKTIPVTSNLSDLELLQQFMATNPSTDLIIAKATEWQSSGHCDAMLRMMVHSGHKSNDSMIALEYAKMHDPNLFKANNCIEKADKDTAAYWYQKSVDAGNTDAKSYLEKL